MTLTKLHSLEFHRNGVSGYPFYSIYATLKEKERSDILITFEVKSGGDLSLDIERTRVISPSDPYFNWRGDNIGMLLQSTLNEKCCKLGLTSIYDLIKVYKRRKKAS